jgi:hypothetical protein
VVALLEVLDRAGQPGVEATRDRTAVDVQPTQPVLKLAHVIDVAHGRVGCAPPDELAREAGPRLERRRIKGCDR